MALDFQPEKKHKGDTFYGSADDSTIMADQANVEAHAIKKAVHHLSVSSGQSTIDANVNTTCNNNANQPTTKSDNSNQPHTEVYTSSGPISSANSSSSSNSNNNNSNSNQKSTDKHANPSTEVYTNSAPLATNAAPHPVDNSNPLTLIS